MPKSEDDVVYQTIGEKLERLEIKLCGRQEGLFRDLDISVGEDEKPVLDSGSIAVKAKLEV